MTDKQHKFDLRQSPVDKAWRAWMQADYASLGIWSAEEQAEYVEHTNGYVPLMWVCVAVDRSRAAVLKKAFAVLHPTPA